MSHWISGIVRGILIGTSFVVAAYFVGAIFFGPEMYHQLQATPLPGFSTTTEQVAEAIPQPSWPARLDQVEYDRRLLALSDYVPPPPPPVATTSTSSVAAAVATSTLQYSSSTNVTVSGQTWPPAAPYPHGGAILPFERIVAYYGNFYSRNMGILGEFPQTEVLARLASTKAAWEAADPDTPVRPAIHYIAMVAQADAGADGMYRNVMPDAQIEQAYSMAKEIYGLLFLDLQVGLSTLERELPKFREYLI